MAGGSTALNLFFLLTIRFDFVHDLVLYLYRNNLQKYIEIYVQKVMTLSVRLSPGICCLHVSAVGPHAILILMWL